MEYEICVEVTLEDLDILFPLDLGPDIFICAGDEVNIDAGAGYDEYEWSPNGETTQAIDAGVGVYELTVTDLFGCTDVDMIEVIENVPDIDIVSDDADNVICEGAMVELEADTDEIDIEWSTGATSTTIEVGPGIFDVTVTDINGCTNVDMIEIIESIPTVTIDSDDNDNIICEGETVELEANTSETDIEWSTGETDDIIEVGPGDYSVTVTDDNGCTAENMITITSVPEPIVTITADPEVICGDETSTLSATPGFFNYLWDNGMFGPEIEVEPGEYEVTVIDVNGCTGVNSIEVIGVDPVDPGEDADIEVCDDGTTYDLESLIDAGDDNGTWDDVDNSGLDLNNNADDVDFEGVDPGVYTFTYTVTALAPCDDGVAVLTVTVNEQFNAGEDNNITSCSSETIDLESLLGDFDAGGEWSDLDNADVDLSDPSRVSFVDVDQGTYEFEYMFEGDFPCQDAIAIITVEIEPNPNAGDDNNISICTGTVVDLQTALSNDAQDGGTFVDADGSGSLSGSDFDSDGLEGQTFDFIYQVGDGASLCGEDEAVITVSVVDQVTAGDDSDNNEICIDETIDLFDYLVNADLGGQFEDASGDVISSEFDASANGEGVFIINYVIGDDVICPADEAEIEITVLAQPNADAVLNSESVCENDCIDLTLNFEGDPQFNYELEFIDLGNQINYPVNGLSETNQLILKVVDNQSKQKYQEQLARVILQRKLEKRLSVLI